MVRTPKISFGCLQVGYFHCGFVVRQKQDIFGFRGCHVSTRRRKVQYRSYISGPAKKNGSKFLCCIKMSTSSRHKWQPHNLCGCV